MSYVDGFVLAVPKDRLDDYRKMAEQGRDCWMKNSALAYVEAVADDVPYGELTSFPRAVQATDDEVVIFSYALYRDRAHRDEVMGKVMAEMDMKPEDMPFDGKRMIWGGFKVIVQA